MRRLAVQAATTLLIVAGCGSPPRCPIDVSDQGWAAEIDRAFETYPKRRYLSPNAMTPAAVRRTLGACLGSLAANEPAAGGDPGSAARRDDLCDRLLIEILRTVVRKVHPASEEGFARRMDHSDGVFVAELQMWFATVRSTSTTVPLASCVPDVLALRPERRPEADVMREKMSSWPPDHVSAWFAENKIAILLGLLALILLTGAGFGALARTE